jgi:DNA-directed RNA polymerase subunit RPC12/RpoP
MHEYICRDCNRIDLVGYKDFVFYTLTDLGDESYCPNCGMESAEYVKEVATA